MIVVFLRAIILYLIIIFCLRIMGKRQIGDMSPSDLVATILISNMAALPIEDVNIPMLTGAVPILALAGSELILTNLNLRFRGFRRLMTGKPMIIIKNGVIQQDQMKLLRMSIDDLLEAARGYNIFDIQDVHYAITETNGSISFLKKFTKENLTAEAMEIKGADMPPPKVIVSDGILITQGLNEACLGEKWLTATLKENNINLNDIFLMTADENAKYFIVPRQN
ncbi:MAG: DUF421 domain-containing protein [Oscillospiraceae bacterium]|nr:DUF421 domain-containing protein [Oscillospiraceae bacterium]